MKENHVTIYDIAREAGVSVATVSRILNGTANVAQDKRERVRLAMEQNDFSPSKLAKGLTNRSSQTIGVLLSDIRSSFYASFYVGLETAAVKRGYNVILCNALNDEDLEREQLEMLVSKGVDVIIICGGRTDTLVPQEEQIKLMNMIAKRVPVVVVGTADYFPCSKLVTDNRPAMEALMGYLIGLGHREFAMIGGLTDKTPTREKQQLFREILRRNGLPCHEEWIIETPNYWLTDGYDTGRKFFRNHRLPTVVLGMNESISLGLMRAAVEANLCIPEDISIAGFDNTYLSEISYPTLTSCGCMYDEFGEALMDMVCRAVAGEREQSLRTVPSGLVVRRSCAKPSPRDNT